MSYAALAVGALATLGFMVYAGRPESAVWFLGMLPFAAWALAPYGVLGMQVRRHAGSARASGVLLVASLLLSAASVFLLWQAFVVEPDAQSALVFVFLPLWQLVYAVIVSAVARGIAAR